jgi:hypothetical protein
VFLVSGVNVNQLVISDGVQARKQALKEETEELSRLRAKVAHAFV